MWKFNDENIVLINVQHFNLDIILDHSMYTIMVNSAHFVKSVPLRTLSACFLYQYVTDISKMCMK